jgi:hypothetical protein
LKGKISKMPLKWNSGFDQRTATGIRSASVHREP